MIVLKSPQEIEKIRVSGRLVREALQHIGAMVQPGVTTLELNEAAEHFLLARGAKLAFKGYRRGPQEPPFPAALCTSINDEIVHGIPSPRRKLREGDIISLDLGAAIDGYYGDAAVTLPVGEVSDEARRLLDVTRVSLDHAIDMALSGNRLQDISYAVQSYVEANGFSVVRDFVGHGIGRAPHEDPQIPNFGKPGRGKRLRPGMVLAIEPMVNAGTFEVRILEDHWTAVTEDGSLSAHFEHTIAITPEGPDILTQ
ncbi:MAG: type I methionyl aminopeptidase [bacterium]